MAKHRNIMGGLVAISVAVLLLLRAFGTIPDGLYDIFARSAPALLIFAGLLLLLRDRIPVGGLIALVLTVALVLNVSLIAFSSRSSQTRTDYQLTIDETVSSGVSLLRVELDLLSTDLNVTLSPASTSDRTITGTFIGSNESLVEVSYSEDGQGGAQLELTETKPNAFQMLEQVGRGTFNLALPPDLALDVLVEVEEGTATLGMAGFDIERLNVNIARGDLTVVIPEYEPAAPDASGSIGTLNVADGDIDMFVSRDAGLRLIFPALSGGRPQIDETIYNELRDGTIESRNFDNAGIVLVYTIRVPNGRVAIQNTPFEDTANP